MVVELGPEDITRLKQVIKAAVIKQPAQQLGGIGTASLAFDPGGALQLLIPEASQVVDDQVMPGLSRDGRDQNGHTN